MKIKELLGKVDKKLKELPQEKLAEIEKTIDEDIEKFFSSEAEEDDLTIPKVVEENFPFLFRWQFSLTNILKNDNITFEVNNVFKS